jgi:hypothetical protein
MIIIMIIITDIWCSNTHVYTEWQYPYSKVYMCHGQVTWCMLAAQLDPGSLAHARDIIGGLRCGLANAHRSGQQQGLTGLVPCMAGPSLQLGRGSAQKNTKRFIDDIHPNGGFPSWMGVVVTAPHHPKSWMTNHDQTIVLKDIERCMVTWASAIWRTPRNQGYKMKTCWIYDITSS